MASLCLLPPSSVLQRRLSQYAVLRDRHTLAIRWAKPGYHGDAVPRRLDDRFDDCQRLFVLCTPERVWRAEKSFLSYYWLVIKNQLTAYELVQFFHLVVVKNNY